MPPEPPDPDTPGPKPDAPSSKVDVNSPTTPAAYPVASFSEPLRGVLSEFRLGDVLDGRYAIVEVVGVGGMGVVYKAVDKRHGKPVAIKLLHPRVTNDSGVARFRREFALAQQVSHPNVCRLNDLGEVNGLLYISMEYVEGQRLDHLIASIGHLSPKQTASLGKQLCAGLAAIHNQAIVHRDLKPSNIMINRSGQLLIMDFGLAIRAEGDEHLTSAGAVVGTTAYLSPEQAGGHIVGPQSDIFAVGLILYEALTGRRPPGDNASLPPVIARFLRTLPSPVESGRKHSAVARQGRHALPGPPHLRTLRNGSGRR